MDLPSNLLPDRTLPRGTFHYVVDSTPRDQAMLEINGGEAGGQYREVLLTASHGDEMRGKRDVGYMFIWGDVDTHFHPRIGASLSTSAPIPWTRQTPIVLSAGAGLKTINVRTVFQSGRWIDGSVTYQLGADIAHLTVLRQPLKRTLLTSDSVSLLWSCSHAVSNLWLCLSDSTDAPRSECVEVSSTAGSWTAGQAVVSSFSYAQALGVSGSLVAPLDATGQCFVRLFALTPLGETV